MEIRLSNGVSWASTPAVVTTARDLRIAIARAYDEQRSAGKKLRLELQIRNPHSGLDTPNAWCTARTDGTQVLVGRVELMDRCEQMLTDARAVLTHVDNLQALCGAVRGEIDSRLQPSLRIVPGMGDRQ